MCVCRAKISVVAPSSTAMPCSTTRSARRWDEARPHSAAEYSGRPGRDFGLRLHAVGRGCAGLRIWLLRGARRPRRLGGVVRLTLPTALRVVFDQFISSGEAEWGRKGRSDAAAAAHGYEGQGPEHSSAASSVTCSCADRTCRCWCPSTPSRQIFHLLRRQMLRPYASRPPSSLRRSRCCATKGRRCRPWKSDQRRLPYGHQVKSISTRCQEVKRVVLCSAKIYYGDGLSPRAGDQDIAVVRIEQRSAGCFPCRTGPSAECQRKSCVSGRAAQPGAWYWFASRQHLINVLGRSRSCCWSAVPRRRHAVVTT